MVKMGSEYFTDFCAALFAVKARMKSTKSLKGNLRITFESMMPSSTSDDFYLWFAKFRNKRKYFETFTMNAKFIILNKSGQRGGVKGRKLEIEPDNRKLKAFLALNLFTSVFLDSIKTTNAEVAAPVALLETPVAAPAVPFETPVAASLSKRK